MLLFAAGVFAQTKSIADAQTEIAAFANSDKFSIAYDAAKYVTRTEVAFDLVEPKTPLAKQFKKFEFSLSALFAIDGIDAKPVRTTFCLNTESKRFFFASDREMTVRLDGESILLGEADRATQVKGGKIRETLCWEIDLQLIRDFGAAADIGFEVGNVNGSFSSVQMQYFKDYAKLLRVGKE